MNERTGFLDGVYDFTVSNLRTLRARWRDLAGTPRALLPATLTDDAVQQLRKQMRDCLDARGGEVSARARAAARARSSQRAASASAAASNWLNSS